MKTAPEDTVVGNLGAYDASDNATAVHSHSQLQSGARLVLHNASVKVEHQTFFALKLLPPICPMSVAGTKSKSDEGHLYLKGEYLGE